MTDTPISPIEAVNAAINSHNPFTNAGIVKEQDVWGKGVPDVPTLNAHASNQVFKAIEFVRKSQSSQDKVTSIAITAQQGVGKTHLLSRIRHELEKVGGALFVYAGGNNYTDLNLVKYQFQQTLADSLSKTGSQEVMQWQEVAAAMANEGRENATTPAELVKKFDQAYKSSLAKNKNLMNALQKQIIKNKSDADPYIIRAILWTLSETQAPYAIKWLSGEELAQLNADELGLPNPSKTNQDREAEALKNIQQILNLVGYYNSIIICFDEIDVKNNSTEDGFPTESVIAGKSIPHNTVEELDRIGKRHLQENYLQAVRLIIGPGEPTKNLKESAQISKVSIIKAMTLQKLVELKAKYPGAINLIELKQYLEPGQIDDKINEYIDKIEKEIKLRSHIIQLVKKHLEKTGTKDAQFSNLCIAYLYNNPPQKLEDRELYDILIELSSPLTGYLGRIKEDFWKRDRFYYLRDLPIN
ncbi:MAG: hypothetical protein AN485_16445 [Anabaena sp. MDT14b]|jgi:hypothetical protein|nr:MAG: hypothetical protein AN485_16445 [Anabaena sp. MDT14b]